MSYLVTQERLAEELKKYRLARLWTFRQMAAVTGFTISALWSLENARVKARELTIAKLKKRLPGFLDGEAA